MRALNASGSRGDGSTPPCPPVCRPVVAAPLVCGVRTGAGAGTVLNRLRPKPGSPLVVIGAGGVGLGAVMAAVVAGCDPVAARRWP
ncbi:NAD(P)-dependent alcohol dehydrogenase, partial [Streptomyces sp. NPDC001034]